MFNKIQLVLDIILVVLTGLLFIRTAFFGIPLEMFVQSFAMFVWLCVAIYWVLRDYREL